MLLTRDRARKVPDGAKNNKQQPHKHGKEFTGLVLTPDAMHDGGHESGFDSRIHDCPIGEFPPLVQSLMTLNTPASSV